MEWVMWILGEKSILDRGNSKYKNPKLEIYLVNLRKIIETSYGWGEVNTGEIV